MALSTVIRFLGGDTNVLPAARKVQGLMKSNYENPARNHRRGRSDLNNIPMFTQWWQCEWRTTTRFTARGVLSL